MAPFRSGPAGVRIVPRIAEFVDYSAKAARGSPHVAWSFDQTARRRHRRSRPGRPRSPWPSLPIRRLAGGGCQPRRLRGLASCLASRRSTGRDRLDGAGGLVAARQLDAPLDTGIERALSVHLLGWGVRARARSELGEIRGADRVAEQGPDRETGREGRPSLLAGGVRRSAHRPRRRPRRACPHLRLVRAAQPRKGRLDARNRSQGPPRRSGSAGEARSNHPLQASGGRRRLGAGADGQAVWPALRARLLERRVADLRPDSRGGRAQGEAAAAGPAAGRRLSLRGRRLRDLEHPRRLRGGTQALPQSAGDLRRWLPPAIGDEVAPWNSEAGTGRRQGSLSGAATTGEGAAATGSPRNPHGAGAARARPDADRRMAPEAPARDRPTGDLRGPAERSQGDRAAGKDSRPT